MFAHYKIDSYMRMYDTTLHACNPDLCHMRQSIFLLCVVSLLAGIPMNRTYCDILAFTLSLDIWNVKVWCLLIMLFFVHIIWFINGGTRFCWSIYWKGQNSHWQSNKIENTYPWKRNGKLTQSWRPKLWFGLRLPPVLVLAML